MGKISQEKTVRYTSHEPLTWRNFILLILAFGLAILGWFMLNPARAQAISLGQMPISVHSEFEADYSADLRGYAVPAVSIDLVDQVVQDEAGSGDAEEQIRKIRESLKTPVPTLKPPTNEPTPKQPTSEPTTRPTREETSATPEVTETTNPTVPVVYPTATATEEEQPKPKKPTRTPTATEKPTELPTATQTATELPNPNTAAHKITDAYQKRPPICRRLPKHQLFR